MESAERKAKVLEKDSKSKNALDHPPSPRQGTINRGSEEYYKPATKKPCINRETYLARTANCQKYPASKK
jgi:hypothetical protein